MSSRRPQPTRQPQHSGQPQQGGGQSQQGRGQSQQGGQSRQLRQGGQRRPQMFRTAVGLPDETRQTVAGMLNQSLADTTDLMTQCKFAHWNVKGMNFYQLHLLFDEVAETLEEHADIIAERATALGGEANGTARAAAANTRIPEIPPDVTTGPEYVTALVERVGMHANSLRQEIEIAAEHDDEDTADMYTELSREVDKQLYFLEAHLQAVNPNAIPASPGASMQGGGVQGGGMQSGSMQGGAMQGGTMQSGSMQGGRASQRSNPSQTGRPSQYRQQSRGRGQSGQMQSSGQSPQTQGSGPSRQMQGQSQSRQAGPQSYGRGSRN